MSVCACVCVCACVRASAFVCVPVHAKTCVGISPDVYTCTNGQYDLCTTIKSTSSRQE